MLHILSNFFKKKFRSDKKLKKANLHLYNIFKDFCKYSGLKNGNLNRRLINENKLNTNSFDKKISKIVTSYYNKNKYELSNKRREIGNKKIGILFTEIYQVGGKTPLIDSFFKSFRDEYDIKIFATFTKGNDKSFLFMNCKSFKRYEYGSNLKEMVPKITKLHNDIVENCIDILFCWIHSQDVVAVSVLCLLQKKSGIKIIIINMQDHFYNLGYNFSHLIIDARPSGMRINNKIRGLKNTLLMPLQSKKSDETIYYNDCDIRDLRNKLNIGSDNYFTLTGTGDYKIFEEDTSEYLKMIRDLLILEPKLKHVLMTEFYITNAQKILCSIFENHEDLLERLIIIDRVADFDIYMQSCDLFIDSFPQGGALIHIDMMRNKKPTVLKINKDNPVRSFEHYLPKNYEYKYDNIEDMKKGVIKLLKSKDEQKKASYKLYDHYLNNYEFDIVKSKYKKLIEESDDLEKFFGKSFYDNDILR